jgi:hypothetical protein
MKEDLPPPRRRRGPLPDLPDAPRIPLKCLVCGAQFRSSERLDAHMARGHPVTLE